MSWRRVLPPFLLATLLLAPSGPAFAQADAADSAWGRGDRSSAARLYTARLAADSADAIALFRLALIAGWQGKPKESIALLDRLLARWPDDNDARLARARMLSASGRQTEADAAVDSVLALSPDDIGALQVRARFTAWRGDFMESERQWRAVLRLEPGNTETRIGLSQVLRWQGRVAAAEEALVPVRFRAPADPDLAGELDRVAQFMESRARSSATVEADDDGNEIATLALEGTAHVGRRIEVVADGYVRRAIEDPRPAGVVTRSGAVSLAVQFEPGWDLRLSGGAAATDRTDIDDLTTWTFSLGSPRRHRWSATIAASRQAADHTAAMAFNGVRADIVEGAIRGRPGPNWTVDASASTGRFLSRRSGVSNPRVELRFALARVLSDGLSLSLQAGGFGFEKDADDGYFDPDLYSVAALELQFRRERPHWAVTAAIAPGVQQVGMDGTPGSAVHAEAGLDLIARPGRSIGINAVLANTGMQQLSAGRSGSYRYASIGLDIRWRFR